jgi:hypothetical protein
MPRQLSAKVSTHPLLSLVLVVLFAGLCLLTWQSLTLRKDIQNLKKSNITFEDLAAQKRLLDGQIAFTNAALRPVADKETLMVFLPELRIEVPNYAPFIGLGRSLMYSPRDGFRDDTGLETDVHTTYYQYPEHELRIDCGDMVRLKFESTPKPYSPHEKAHTVKLKDGRTLQIYELVNEKECNQSWANSGVNPSQMAELFMQAQSI